jgi:pimeloyl-ACP methyl ester carboxylesterase
VASARDPVLLLHGQPGAARDWDRVRAAIGPGVETIAVERPGWDGRSRATDLGGNVEAALSALERAGVERATVVGHSFSGAVAALLAAEHPERVGALVLIAPSANVASLYRLDYALAAPVVGAAASAALLGAAALALRSRRLRRRLADTLALDDRYLHGWGRLLRAPDTWRAFVIEQRALVAELPHVETLLGGIAAPTAIVAGGADRIVPLSSARRLARQIPGAELVVVAGANHPIPLQYPDRVAEVIAAVGR